MTRQNRNGIAALLVVALVGVELAAQSAAGLRWTPPAGWKNEGEREFRAATYEVPAATGDREAGECGVYFFGAGQGGSIQANIDRWKGQFTGPDGNPAAAVVGKKTVHGLTVTTIDAAGKYTGAGGPFGGGAALPGYRLLGAIVEGPAGNIFVKFTGPAKTIAANQAKFDQMIASFDRAK